MWKINSFSCAGLLKADEGTVNLNKDIDIGALIENPEFSNYSTIKKI